MPPSFVIDFTALLLLGPHAMLVVAAAGAIMQGLTDPQGRHWLRRVLNVATVVAAAQAAGLVHQALGGTIGTFIWPEQAVPIALAVIGYCVVKSASAEIIVPLLTKQPVNRSWPASLLRGAPGYFIGASLAVGLVAMAEHKMWEVALVAALPLFFAYRAYCAHVIQLDEAQRRREVIDSLNQGMAVVDSNNLVTLWDPALERILGCPRERALGRSLVGAVPALGKTQVPRMIADAVGSGTPRTLAQSRCQPPRAPGHFRSKSFPLPAAPRCFGMMSPRERALTARSSETSSGSRSPRKARMTGFGNGIRAGRSSTVRADGARCSGCPRPGASVPSRNGWIVFMGRPR